MRITGLGTDAVETEFVGVNVFVDTAGLGTDAIGTDLVSVNVFVETVV